MRLPRFLRFGRARRATPRRVLLHRNVFDGAAPEVIEVEHIAEWVLSRAATGPALTRYVFRGEPSESTDISRDFDALMANDAEYYTVLELPGGPALPFIQIFLAAYSVVSVFMASKADMPNNVNRAQESPNNALGERGNALRILQRVEDIFGTVPAIPSVMMQTYTKWLAGKRMEYGYYCVTRGYAQLSDLKDGDTLLTAIDNASAAVYWPFTSPNSGDAPVLQIGPAIIDRVLTTRRQIEVDGITLKAANQIQLEVSVSAGYYLLTPGPAVTIGATTVPASSNDRVVQFFRRPNFNAVCAVGQTVTITAPDRTSTGTGGVSADGSTNAFIDTIGAGLFGGLAVGSTFTIAGFSVGSNNGTFTVTSKPDVDVIVVSGGTLTDEPGVIATITTFQSGAPWSGTRSIAEVGDGYLILAGAAFPANRNDPPFGGPNTNIVANNGLSEYTSWVTMPALDLREVWVNAAGLNGMLKDNGGQFATSVTYQLQLQQLDGALNPVGGIITANDTLTAVTQEEIGETLEVTLPWTGPTRVRMVRLTPFDYYFQGTVVDEVKWTDLYGVSHDSKLHYGNKTTIHTITQANPRATAVRERQLNCLASRLLPKWTGSAFTGAFDSDGRHVSGTIHATSFAHEIIAAMALDRRIGNRPATDVDMVQMTGVFGQLYAMHPDAPTFNYTLDSSDLSFKESVALVANAVFCRAYMQSGKVRLALDHQQANNTFLITHRNKQPKAQRITRTFRNDASYDGVEFTYQDPVTLRAETIRLPLDGSATKPKPFEIAGIRSFAQAWLRANREWAKVKGQRASLSEVCTTDARLLVPYARVECVDNTRFKGNDGEVLKQDGLKLTLSQRVDFTTPGPHSIVLRRLDGTLQSITATTAAGLEPNQLLLATLPSEPIKTTNDADGVRTIYSFGNDARHNAQAWLIGDIGSPKDNYVSITAINYSDSYYAADTQPIPPRESVIY